MFVGVCFKMEKTVVCLVLVLLSLATVWGQMEIPCIMACDPRNAAGNAAPGLQTTSSPNKLCCPAGFSRTVVQDKCTCSIPLPSIIGATGTPNMNDLMAAMLFQYQAELMDYIQRMTSASRTPPASEKLPKFIPAV